MKNTLLAKKWIKQIPGIIISIGCLLFIISKISLEHIYITFINFQKSYIIWGLISLIFGYILRIVRWSILLKSTGAKVSPIICAAPFLGSIALNNIFPMRLGDLVRALIFPSAIGVNKIVASGSLIIERLIDLTTLLMCLIIGLTFSLNNKIPNWMLSTTLILCLLSGNIIVLIFLFSRQLSQWFNSLNQSSLVRNHPNRQRFISLLRDLLNSFEAMSRLPVLTLVLGLSILIWIGEMGLFWSLLFGFGLITGPQTAMVITAMTTLSTLIPSSPGYIGSFHLAAYTAISMLGGTPEQAAGFSILSHLGVWLPTTLAGVLAILTNPQMFNIKLKRVFTYR